MTIYQSRDRDDDRVECDERGIGRVESRRRNEMFADDANVCRRNAIVGECNDVSQCNVTQRNATLANAQR